MIDFTGITKEILAPILTAVLAGLGVVFQDWRTRRTKIGRRRLALEDARAQVAFTGEWWQAHKALETSPEALRDAAAQAADWLGKASTLMNMTDVAIPRAQPLTLRRILLLDPLGSTAAKVFRVGYLACTGVMFQALGASLTQRLIREEYRPEWVDYYLVYLIIGVLAALLALGFRFLSVEAEEYFDTNAARGVAQRGFLRHALLLDTFHRTSARLVRLLFHVGLIALVGYVVYFNYLVIAARTLVPLPSQLASFAVYGAAVLGLRRWAATLEPASAYVPANRGDSTATVVAAPVVSRASGDLDPYGGSSLT